MLDKLFMYMQYPFVRYALIVGVLIALCSSLLGVTLVLKRFSFIGDGLSHVAFGTMAVAAVCNLSNEMILVLPVTIASAILLLRSDQKTGIRGDAAVAMISVTSLAFGYLIMNIFSSSSNLSGDVCITLFGSTSILTLDVWEVALCIALSVAVVVIFILLYNKIFAVTFDENFSKAVGTKADSYNLLIAIIIAVIIVLAMNLVGSLLISALIIFPALSSMRLFRSFRAVTICSAVLSALSSTMVYSEVYDMLARPELYTGKTVKMSGQFTYYHDVPTDYYYYACIIQDATACCSQGIEFEPAGDYTYPDDFPEVGTNVTVVGVFDSYMDGQYRYCTLRNAVFTS